MKCRLCRKLTGAELISHQQETHGIPFPQGFSPKENKEVEVAYTKHIETGKRGKRIQFYGEAYLEQEKEGMNYGSNRAKEVYQSLTLWEKLRIVFWYLRRRPNHYFWFCVKMFVDAFNKNTIYKVLW